nr:MAG TPA: hypothetical protein [Caudoviricetes sp.]
MLENRSFRDKLVIVQYQISVPLWWSRGECKILYVNALRFFVLLCLSLYLCLYNIEIISW